MYIFVFDVYSIKNNLKGLGINYVTLKFLGIKINFRGQNSRKLQMAMWGNNVVDR